MLLNCVTSWLSSIQMNVSLITPVLPWDAHSPSERKLPGMSMSVDPNCFNTPQPTSTLDSITFLCMFLLLSAMNSWKHRPQIAKKYENITKSPKKIQTTFLPNQQKRAQKTVHPNKTNPTPTSHHQATYWCTSLSGIPLMRANKVKCSRAVKVPMRASNCGQYPIKRRTCVFGDGEGVNHQTLLGVFGGRLGGSWEFCEKIYET